ncbi:uncharacterized protein [Spinacia oleracea]|uniref:Uncharacterized protein isoform X2 n=1 Tax=Spinacia oleracea TaxID=3562 RepID=A0ABM3RCY5_SPIOL|nr:uncharacterized protein LOC110805475 isoform X2 [Spinacia oleracea]XP_056693470.1 uncharacterized protein LOC110805475 isoform X2 [Spinacia oleracea]
MEGCYTSLIIGGDSGFKKWVLVGYITWWAGSSADEDMKTLVEDLLSKYGQIWESNHPNSARPAIITDGIPVNPRFLKRLEGYWEENEEEEFKTMFLIATLQMVLCPTQCARLSSGLLYVCTLGKKAREYDWCKLVYDFFMEKVKVFCRDFYTFGWVKGIGGCSLYLVIFYLGRLKRRPVQWGLCPRSKAWNMEEIKKAKSADRFPGATGDYGYIGCIDVAYGDNQHPKAPRVLGTSTLLVMKR